MNENARNLLKDYAKSRNRISTLSQELASHTATLNDIRAAVSGMVHSDNLAEAVDNTAKTVSTLTNDINKAAEQCRLAIDALSALEDSEARSVLEYHYLAGMTLKEIAQKMYCCHTTVKNLHRSGLEAVEAYLRRHGIGGN